MTTKFKTGDKVVMKHGLDANILDPVLCSLQAIVDKLGFMYVLLVDSEGDVLLGEKLVEGIVDGLAYDDPSYEGKGLNGIFALRKAGETELLELLK